MKWTPDQDEILKRMALKGFSMSQIGNALHCSRNACIGRWHRLKAIDVNLTLPFKTSRILETVEDPSRISPQLLRNTTPKRRCEPRRAMPKTSKVGVGFLLPALPEPSRGPAIGILDITGCKWAIGEDPKVYGTHTFCNHAVDGNSPYCAYHRQLNVRAKVEPAKVERFRTPISLVRAGVA